MKKIYALLAIFLCIGMIAPVYAASIENATVDSWGRYKVIEDGNVIYFNQKVAVTESPLSYDFAYKVIENCTVTVKTNGDVVVVDENGASIVSTNGFGFRFSEDVRLNFMAWNNFPLTGVVEEEKVVVKEKGYQPITDVMNYLIDTYGKSGKDISFRDLPKEITYKNMTFEQIRYSEPTDGSYENKTQHFRAYYEDLGGYYHIEIEASHPWTAFSYAFDGYFNNILLSSSLSTYQNFIASATGDEEKFTSLEANSAPLTGNFKMNENWTENYTIYHGDVYIDYYIKRLADSPFKPCPV